MPLLDRLLRPVRPLAVEGFRAPPRQIAEHVWTVEGRLRMPGGVGIPLRSVLAKLGSGEIFIHSPPPIGAELRDAIARLGPVRYIVAPNSFHHVFAAAAAHAFPSAQLHVAPGLPERSAELASAFVLGTVRPPWTDEVAQSVYGPVGGLAEVVFFHRASRTLLLADLCFNVHEARSLREQLFWRAAGVWKRFGPSRTIRLTLLRDADPLRALLDQVFRWDFERITVAHGDLLEHDARQALRRAFGRYLRK